MKLRPSRRSLAIALGVVLALGVIGLLATPPIARAKGRKAAEAQHLDVTIGSVRPGFFAVTLKDVRVAPVGESGNTPTFPEVRASLSAGLSLRRVEVHGGEVQLEGPLEDLEKKLSRWREARPKPTHEAEKKGPEREVVVDGLALTWGSPSTGHDLRVGGASVGVDGERLEVRAESIEAKAAEGELVVSDATVELDGQRRLKRVESSKVLVAVVGKAAKPEAPAAAGGAVPEPPPLPVVPPRKLPKGSKPLPKAAPVEAEPFVPLVPFPDLEALRAKVGLVTRTIAEKLPEGSEVRLPQATFEMRGATPFSVGPGAFTLLRGKESVVVAFRSSGEGAGGGDEFALVINETDPAKVQKLLQEINERVRKDPSVRRVFTEESKARAAAIKHEVGAGNTMSESQAQSYRLGYAPYSQPNVSVGSVVVNGEDVPHAFEIAERQAAKQKIENKTEFKSDTTKYGGSKPSPDAKPNLTYLADAQPSAIGRAGNQNRVGTSVKDAQGFVAQERVRERFRAGEIAIVEYKDELGKPLLQMERYYTDAIGERHFVTHEVFVNERTGLIDARHPRGREILNTFVTSTKTPNRGGVWVNLENLGVLNYGAGGTINGDRALAATTEAIKRVIRDDNLPIKWQGSEFFIGVENVAPSELKFVTERIQTALAKDPSIKKIYDQYTRNLEVELNGARLQRDQKRIEELEANLKKIQAARSTPFSVYGTPIRPGDTVDSILARTRGQRYDD